MSDQTKPSDLKGMLKPGTPVSIEEMNDAICKQGAAAGLSRTEYCDPALGDAQARGETQHSIADMLNDSDGNNIEYEPAKLNIRVGPAKE